MIGFSEPVNAILQVKRDFADVIKTTHLERGGSWIIQMGQSNQINVFFQLQGIRNGRTCWL